MKMKVVTSVLGFTIGALGLYSRVENLRVDTANANDRIRSRPVGETFTPKQAQDPLSVFVRYAQEVK